MSQTRGHILHGSDPRPPPPSSSLPSRRIIIIFIIDHEGCSRALTHLRDATFISQHTISIRAPSFINKHEAEWVVGDGRVGEIQAGNGRFHEQENNALNDAHDGRIHRTYAITCTSGALPNSVINLGLGRNESGSLTSASVARPCSKRTVVLAVACNRNIGGGRRVVLVAMLGS